MSLNGFVYKGIQETRHVYYIRYLGCYDYKSFDTPPDYNAPEI
jgi:hypothetical protein